MDSEETERAILTLEPVEARLTTMAGFRERSWLCLSEEKAAGLATRSRRILDLKLEGGWRSDCSLSNTSINKQYTGMANKSDKRVAAENAATRRLLKYGTATTQVGWAAFCSHVLSIMHAY